MNTKEKILSALSDMDLSDITESRLIDVFVDAYNQLRNEIVKLKGENAQERENLYNEREAMCREMDKARRDPLYFNNARQYVFKNDQHKTVIFIYAEAGKLNVDERKGGYIYSMREAPEEI